MTSCVQKFTIIFYGFRSSVAMEAVYNKTLTKLFNGAKNVRNNNLQQQSNCVVANPDQLLPSKHQR